jgi:hypothetical protein
MVASIATAVGRDSTKSHPKFVFKAMVASIATAVGRGAGWVANQKLVKLAITSRLLHCETIAFAPDPPGPLRVLRRAEPAFTAFEERT